MFKNSFLNFLNHNFLEVNCFFIKISANNLNINYVSWNKKMNCSDIKTISFSSLNLGLLKRWTKVENEIRGSADVEKKLAENWATFIISLGN